MEPENFRKIKHSRGHFVKSLDCFGQSTCYNRFLESLGVGESNPLRFQFFIGHFSAFFGFYNKTTKFIHKLCLELYLIL